MRFKLFAVACACFTIFCPSVHAATVQSAQAFSTGDPNSVFDVSHGGNNYALGSGTAFDNPGAGTYDVRDIFGGNFGSYAPEPGAVVFADNEAIGTVVTVQATLPSAVSLKAIKLWLGEDSDNTGHRSTREFQLFAGSTLIDDVNVLDATGGQSFTGVYGGPIVRVDDALVNAPSSASYTLRFIQNQAAGDVSGLRVGEFQAFVPEPSILTLLLGIGLIKVLGRRRPE